MVLYYYSLLSFVMCTYFMHTSPLQLHNVLYIFIMTVLNANLYDLNLSFCNNIFNRYATTLAISHHCACMMHVCMSCGMHFALTIICL